MGKYTHALRLNKKEQDELFIDFVKSVSSLRNSVEAANYIKDLLSEPEVLMLARRLQIARLLTAGHTYQRIYRLTKASYTTIAKVQTWLKLYGEGYRTVISRTEKKSSEEKNLPWRQLKQKYPMYFWPQILLEETLKAASNREKRRLLKVVSELKEKTRLSKEIEKLLLFK